MSGHDFMELGTPDSASLHFRILSEEGRMRSQYVLEQSAGIRVSEQGYRLTSKPHSTRDEVVKQATELLEDTPWLKFTTELPRIGYVGTITVFYSTDKSRMKHTFKAMTANELAAEIAHIDWRNVFQVIEQRPDDTKVVYQRFVDVEELTRYQHTDLDEEE